MSRAIQNVNKQHEGVSVRRFGAKGDGTTDDYAAIQSALSSGELRILLPPGNYRVTQKLLMPALYGFVFEGSGTASFMMQASPTVLGWSTSGTPATYQQSINNIAFDGTNGAADTLSTAGAGGCTLRNLYFRNTPTGYSSLLLDGSGGSYAHDHRVDGIQIYSTLAGQAGIRCGSLSSDQQVNNFIMNGTFQVNNCIQMDAGAQTLQLTNSHPYNAAQNILKISGAPILCQFDSVRFDNALGTLVDATGLLSSTFSDCLFQATNIGQNSVALANCSDNLFKGCLWDGAGGAISALVETGTSNNNRVLGGQLYTPGSWSTPWNLIGANSYVRNIYPYLYGTPWYFSIVGQATQAQNSAVYYGINGYSVTETNVYYTVPKNCFLETLYVAVTTTPAAGQTFTFQIVKNSTPTGATITISSGQFSGSATLNVSLTAGDRISLLSTFSATSGASQVRATWTFNT